MSTISKYFMIFFNHLKIVFGIIQIIINTIKALFNREKVSILTFLSFKHNDKVRVVYNAKGVFFIYVLGYGFIDQVDGEFDLLFNHKKVKALFFGWSPKYRSIEVIEEAFVEPLKVKNKLLETKSNSLPQLYHKLRVKNNFNYTQE